jgi:hypothetical protein
MRKRNSVTLDFIEIRQSAIEIFVRGKVTRKATSDNYSTDKL